MESSKNTAYYDYRQNPPRRGVENPGYHVELVGQQSEDLEAAMQYAEKVSSLSEGDVQAAVCAIVKYMEGNLHRLSHFTIDGLGSFSLQIKGPHIDDPTLNAGRDIRVSGIRFTPDRKLLNHIAGDITFHRTATPRPHRTSPTEEELAAALRSYFADPAHPYLRTRDLMSLARCRRTKACQIAQELKEKGWIADIGEPRSPLYVAGGQLPQAEATATRP